MSTKSKVNSSTTLESGDGKLKTWLHCLTARKGLGAEEAVETRNWAVDGATWETEASFARRSEKAQSKGRGECPERRPTQNEEGETEACQRNTFDEASRKGSDIYWP